MCWLESLKDLSLESTYFDVGVMYDPDNISETESMSSSSVVRFTPSRATLMTSDTSIYSPSLEPQLIRNKLPSRDYVTLVTRVSSKQIL